MYEYLPLVIIIVLLMLLAFVGAYWHVEAKSLTEKLRLLKGHYAECQEECRKQECNSLRHESAANYAKKEIERLDKMLEALVKKKMPPVPDIEATVYSEGCKVGFQSQMDIQAAFDICRHDADDIDVFLAQHWARQVMHKVESIINKKVKELKQKIEKDEKRT